MTLFCPCCDSNTKTSDIRRVTPLKPSDCLVNPFVADFSEMNERKILMIYFIPQDTNKYKSHQKIYDNKQCEN